MALLVIAVIGFSATNYSIKNAYGFEPAGSGPPMVFSGNVYVNGLAAPDGLNVTAWDSSVSSSQAVGSVLTSNEQYSNLVVCGQPSQNCNNGDTITSNSTINSPPTRPEHTVQVEHKHSTSTSPVPYPRRKPQQRPQHKPLQFKLRNPQLWSQ